MTHIALQRRVVRVILLSRDAAGTFITILLAVNAHTCVHATAKNHDSHPKDGVVLCICPVAWRCCMKGTVFGGDMSQDTKVIMLISGSLWSRAPNSQHRKEQDTWLSCRRMRLESLLQHRCLAHFSRLQIPVCGMTLRCAGGKGLIPEQE